MAEIWAWTMPSLRMRCHPGRARSARFPIVARRGGSGADLVLHTRPWRVERSSALKTSATATVDRAVIDDEGDRLARHGGFLVADGKAEIAPDALEAEPVRRGFARPPTRLRLGPEPGSAPLQHLLPFALGYR